LRSQLHAELDQGVPQAAVGVFVSAFDVPIFEERITPRAAFMVPCKEYRPKWLVPRSQQQSAEAFVRKLNPQLA
jgi:hypothetical protein